MFSPVSTDLITPTALVRAAITSTATRWEALLIG